MAQVHALPAPPNDVVRFEEREHVLVRRVALRLGVHVLERVAAVEQLEERELVEREQRAVGRGRDGRRAQRVLDYEGVFKEVKVQSWGQEL